MQQSYLVKEQSAQALANMSAPDSGALSVLDLEHQSVSVSEHQSVSVSVLDLERQSVLDSEHQSVSVSATM